MNNQAQLSDKDKQFRDFSLHDNMWRVVLYVGFPLALYQSLTQLFKIFDSMMAAHISATAVSTVAYLSQINMMLSALGGGLAVGASIKISEAYGSGDFQLVKKRVSTLFAMCAILGLALLVILVPFTPQFLRLAKTPEEFIAGGTQYFILELFGMVISFFNNVYIAIERARGNSKRILNLNMVVIGLKLALTALFVYVLNYGINMISVATIISQTFLLAAACKNLNQKDNAFGFSLAAISLKPEVTRPMIALSIPVIVEKVAFSFGKVIVNSMSTIYTPLTVGALGISNNIGGFTTMPQNGFQEGGSAIISQNLGAGKRDRVLKSYLISLLYSFGIGGAMGLLLVIFGKQFLSLFTADPEVITAGLKRLTIMGFSYGVSAFMDCTIAASRALGKSLVPMFIVIMGSCVFRVVWVYTVFAYFKTIPSLYLLYVFSWTITAIAEIIYFLHVYRGIFPKANAVA